MLIIRASLHFLLFVWVASFFAGIVSPAAAQTPTRSNPCKIDLESFTESADSSPNTDRLTRAGHEIIYDSSQGICWLADADLAGDPQIQAELGLAGINPDGTMTYSTALKFVDALNNYHNGRGYLGHTDWQLPDTPQNDVSCSSYNNGSFGASCTGSALGNLYYVGLARTFPDSVVPDFTNKVWPFNNLQPSLYWTLDHNSGGQVTFSFNTGLNGANTTKYNFFHVLPMVRGPLCRPPAGTGVVPYTCGSAAGKAVYDTLTGISWTIDANLAASNNFGLTGTTTITSSVNPNILTVPLVDVDGAMLLATADGAGGWLEAMNASNYAGSNQWTLPHLSDLLNLYQDLNLKPGDRRFLEHRRVSLFRHLQPFFYWACERVQNSNSQAPCDPALNPGISPDGTPFEYSFNFDNGFEGTDLDNKEFYVMVYYPAGP